LELELLGEPTTITTSQRGAMNFHRVLAVLRGVADVVLLGPRFSGRGFQRAMNGARRQGKVFV
jgi:hypothetical protein